MTTDSDRAARHVIGTALRTARSGIRETSYNVCQVTHWWKAMWGWGDGSAWCAMTSSMIGYDAGVLNKDDMSAGAWALVDHLTTKGLGLKDPEPGCLVAYSWGSGHVEVVVKVLGEGYVMTVGGNTGGNNPQEGDGCYLIRRYLPGNLHYNPFARFPGVANDNVSEKYPDWCDRLYYNRPGDLMRGPSVRHIQKQLGLTGRDVDGVYGPTTAAQVSHFQQRHGLPVDGAVHRRTATLLDARGK